MHECSISLKPFIKNSYCLKEKHNLRCTKPADYLSRRDRIELDFGLSCDLCVSRCLLCGVYNITSRKRLWFFLSRGPWNVAFIGMKFLIILKLSFPELSWTWILFDQIDWDFSINCDHFVIVRDSDPRTSAGKKWLQCAFEQFCKVLLIKHLFCWSFINL